MDTRPGIIKVLQAVAGQPINPSDDEGLFSGGILDSFALPDFVSRLEQEFQITVPDSDLNARKFNTIAKVEAYLADKGK